MDRHLSLEGSTETEKQFLRGKHMDRHYLEGKHIENIFREGSTWTETIFMEGST